MGDMGEIRQALAEQEIRKLADIRRREKNEEKAAKARVLAQIEADKAARKAEKEAASKNKDAASAPNPAAAVATPAAKKDYSDCRLQIRQTNGQAIVQTFGDEDYENTLENLGLVPSAVLMVTK